MAVRRNISSGFESIQQTVRQIRFGRMEIEIFTFAWGSLSLGRDTVEKSLIDDLRGLHMGRIYCLAEFWAKKSAVMHRA